MSDQPVDRRKFLRGTAAAGGGLVALAASGYVGYRVRGTPASSNGVTPLTEAISKTTRGVGEGTGPFISRPDLLPPAVTLTQEVGWTPSSPRDGSYFIITPKAYVADGPGQSGLMILDRDGELVWFHPETNPLLTSTDMQVQRYRGRPVLTWWTGEVPTGVGHGTGYIADATYQTFATVQAGNGLRADTHELFLTPQGTALITAYRTTTADLSSVGGPSKGVLFACQAQEIDVATGKMIFSWDSLDHVAITESYADFAGGTSEMPYDYFHINSVSLADDGDLLISSRNTWTIYKVSRKTGEVLWRLNGKKSDFTMEPGAKFFWQHHARWLPGNHVSLFDDGASPAEEAQSRGLILKINESTKRCSVTRQYTHPAKPLAANQGSVQVLPDGRVLVGWGDQPYFSEFLRDGTMVTDGRFPADDQTYRAFRAPWVGRPSAKPDLAVKSFTTARTVYVSWNGDTETAYWSILAGATPETLRETIIADKTGFETVVAVQSGGPYFSVVALDASKRALAQSATVRV